jgi:hypothetical protein
MDLVDRVLEDPLRAYTVLAVVALVALSLVAWLARVSAAFVPIRTWLILLPAIFFPLWLGPLAWAIFITVVAILGAKGSRRRPVSTPSARSCSSCMPPSWR